MSSPDSQQREEQQQQLTALFDVFLSLLALVFLGLFILELAADLAEPWASLVSQGQIGIWVIFVAAFLIEFTIAPSKRRYLRQHWLVALSLTLPLLRIFRVLHALRVLRGARLLRGFNLARTGAATNRAIRSLSDLASVTQFGYLVLVTAVVVVVSAAAGTFFERGEAGTPITSFGEALWWSSTLITTVGGPHEPITVEGRVLAVVLRIYGLVVAGYFTARLAVFFLGGHRQGERRRQADLAQLRDQIERLTEAIEVQGNRARANGQQPRTPQARRRQG